jgi:valyl-tRNA synthetase
VAVVVLPTTANEVQLFNVLNIYFKKIEQCGPMEKQYNYKDIEQQMQQLWAQEGVYLAANNPGPLYSVDTPPPTVSGALHIGHIFSYTQTDIVARYKRMSGFSVFYPFGFDDNGLPTERYVEKKLQVSSYALGRSAFIKLCLQETKEVEHQFKQLWQKVGLSVDWNLCYSTISDSTRALSQESFIKLVEKGHVYRAYEPALFCATCRTSVAQAELDDAQKPSFFNDIVFQDQKGNDLIIGTTRPELLPACVALLYNPADERYRNLEGTEATAPLYGFKVSILADESVSIEKGTGLVMCCTFGDKTDIAWFKKFKLPYKPVIGLDGRWAESTGPLAGLKAPAARQKVLDLLKEQNLLVRQQPITHAVNVHERCKQEIEYIALSQWFINILANKQIFLDMADRIAWHPAFMKARYKNWVENISWDWCISRQRFFGIPFPAWHCADCAKIVLADIKDLPIDPQEVAYTQPCPGCGGSNLVADTDVMDTWNTSSLTPYICYSFFDPAAPSPFAQDTPPTFIPMGMRPQAHDIIRTWAFYTIVKTWMHHGTIPWNEIVISGHVLSDAKEKISKSKENNKMAPEALLEQYPADVIRYWTASGSLGQDVAFSDNQLKIGQRLITKLWNATRFVQEHIAAAPATMPAELGACNEWLLHEATATFDQYQQYFVAHEFGLALNVVEKFFWTDFCDNYLELVKHQLFNPAEYDPQAVAATRSTLRTVGLRIIQLYAPYLPHITEHLYQLLYRTEQTAISLHQTRFADLQQSYRYTESAVLMQTVLMLVGAVRRLKTEQQLSLKTPLAHLQVYGENEVVLRGLEMQDKLIKGVAQAATISYTLGTGTTGLQQVEDIWRATVVLE